jgi:hypothetical protein
MYSLLVKVARHVSLPLNLLEHEVSMQMNTFFSLSFYVDELFCYEIHVLHLSTTDMLSSTYLSLKRSLVSVTAVLSLVYVISNPLQGKISRCTILKNHALYAFMQRGSSNNGCMQPDASTISTDSCVLVEVVVVMISIGKHSVMDAAWPWPYGWSEEDPLLSDIESLTHGPNPIHQRLDSMSWEPHPGWSWALTPSTTTWCLHDQISTDETQQFV